MYHTVASDYIMRFLASAVPITIWRKVTKAFMLLEGLIIYFSRQLNTIQEKVDSRYFECRARHYRA